jgi:hypothetical protein
MKGKTNTTSRRLSLVALAASIAAVAIPAASAGGGYQAGLVPSKLGSPDPRDTAKTNQTFSPSVIDRQIGSPDPRDAVQKKQTVSNEFHLYPRAGVDESFSARSEGVLSEILRDAAQEHGANGFLGQTTNARDVIRDAAQEHGAAGFGNVSAS